tara:strand:- start:357 stop:1223 length:867 start_codon:yes stop_codon:yes gene_type:complete
MKTTAILPARASQGLAHLQSQKNDIVVFVEDNAGRNLWKKVLRKFLPAGKKIENVNPLGGRKNVLDACKADLNKSGPPRLYIIDADLDIIKGKSKPRLKNLYRLRRYCVENYLIHDDGFVHIAQTFDADIDESNAKNQIDSSGWIQRNSVALRQLFIWYAVASELNCRAQTVKYHLSRLTQNNSAKFDICQVKTKIRLIGLYRELRRNHSRAEIVDLLKKYEENIRRKTELEFVSGKTYIIPGLEPLLKRDFGVNLTASAFSSMLAEKMPPAVDPYLKRTISNLIKAS